LKIDQIENFRDEFTFILNVGDYLDAYVTFANQMKIIVSNFGPCLTILRWYHADNLLVYYLDLNDDLQRKKIRFFKKEDIKCLWTPPNHYKFKTLEELVLAKIIL